MEKRHSRLPVAPLVGVLIATSGWSAGAVLADDHAVVLRYEEVAPNLNKQKGVTPEQFIADLDYLEENGFTIWPLAKIVDYLRSGKPLPKNTVAISFDNAFRSMYQNAFPILKERHYPFTLFIVPKNSDEDVKSFVNWDELREMAQNGATIANHTQNYTYLVRQLDKETEKHWSARVREEYSKAQDRISKEIGSSTNLVSYPYGEYDEKIRDIMKARRWVAFSTEAGAIGRESDFAALPRIAISGSNADIKSFEIKIHSLPMPISKIETDKIIVDKKTNPPQMKISLFAGSWQTDQLTCVLSGTNSKLTVKWEDAAKTIFAVKNARTLNPGRVSYSCTMPAGKNALSGKPMQYLYSSQWLIPLANGKWYKE